MRRIVPLVILLALALLAPGGVDAQDAQSEERNCSAFATQQEAQAYFDAHGGSKTNNVDFLDADHDGIACEHLGAGAAAGAAAGARTGDSNAGSGFPWLWLWVGLGIVGIGLAGVGGAALSRRSRRATSPDVATPVMMPAPDLTTPDAPDDIPCDPPPPGWPTITPERARALAAMPDAAYRVTPEWTQRAEAILQATGGRCQLCGADLMLPDQVRHRTTERRGDELPCDLVVLCDRCAAQLGIATTTTSTTTTATAST
ncbi:MAG: excalibur calcium-binding domain-containing protein [Thermomicrobiales bacterium]